MDSISTLLSHKRVIFGRKKVFFGGNDRPLSPGSELMNLTPYHAKYLAYELTRRCASDSVEKLASVLADAQVDLNPHQVEAALFAFRSPFSKGRSSPTKWALARR